MFLTLEENICSHTGWWLTDMTAKMYFKNNLPCIFPLWIQKSDYFPNEYCCHCFTTLPVVKVQEEEHTQ